MPRKIPSIPPPPKKKVTGFFFSAVGGTGGSRCSNRPRIAFWPVTFIGGGSRGMNSCFPGFFTE